MPMVWNADNNSKLFGLVLRDLKLTKDDMARYAEQMGNGCTEQAVYFQLYKLKRDGNTSQCSTPKKRGRKTSSSPTRGARPRPSAPTRALALASLGLNANTPYPYPVRQGIPKRALALGVSPLLVSRASQLPADKLDVEVSAKKMKEEPKDEHEVAAIKIEDDD